MLVTLAIVKDYLRSWYDAVFRKGYFACIVCMLALVISLNYTHSLLRPAGWWPGFLFTYLLYLLPFAFAYLLQWFYFEEDRSLFYKKGFWILLLLAPALFAVRTNFSFQETWFKTIVHSSNSRYLLSLINYIARIIVLLLPVIFIWYIKDKKEYPLYGFTKSSNNKIYWLLLAFMIPLVMLAASTPDFLKAYPKAITNADLHPGDSTGRFLLFELVYGMDFLSIEFFFRGFLIITFIKYCGMRAIIPAACFYCCIHLGKPMAEAISSFFGGLLLGIISYNTLSIWGGLLIHVGIAWMMEIAAYVGHHF